MVELNLKYKTKKVKEVGKQELQKDNPYNLIDIYFGMTRNMFKVKNIKIRKDQDV